MNKIVHNKQYIYSIIVGVLVSLVITTACKRRPLEDENANGVVNIEIDWSKSGLEPGEASVIFYPEAGGEPVITYVYGTTGTAELPVGKYSVVTINNKYDDFDAIAFRGVDKYNTIEAFIKPIKNPNYTPVDKEITVDNPDMLVSDSRDELIVGSDTKTRAESGSADIKLTMHQVTAKAQVVIHVKNLYYIRKGTQNAIVKGFVQSVNLSTRKTSSTPVTQFFELPKVEFYEGNFFHGTMEGTLTVFGECTPIGDESYPVEFTLNALLRDKEQTKFVHTSDVTNLIEYKVDLGLNIFFEIGADPEKENPPIVVPKVETDDPSSGFDPEVGDWEDGEDIVKPM